MLSLPRRVILRSLRLTLASVAGSMLIAAAICFAVLPNAPILAVLSLAAFIPLVVAFLPAVAIHSRAERINALYEELQTANAELQRLNAINELRATTDEMTGLFARRHFFDSAQNMLREKRQGAVIMLDVDRFKIVNDTWGHAAGDEALQQVAKAIQEAVRVEDIVGRLGGEEFAVYLPGADTDIALAVAERIRRNVENIHFTPNGETVHPLSVSLGLVSDSGADTIDIVMKLADSALYRSKCAGRNRVSVSSPEDRLRAA